MLLLVGNLRTWITSAGRILFLAAGVLLQLLMAGGFFNHCPSARCPLSARCPPSVRCLPSARCTFAVTVGGRKLFAAVAGGRDLPTAVAAVVFGSGRDPVIVVIEDGRDHCFVDGGWNYLLQLLAAGILSLLS